jgi:vacuolar-type H+-ATPase subunit E/Vma4
MGIEELSSALRDDAAKVENDILARARARAEQIHADAEARLEALGEREARILVSNKAFEKDAKKRVEIMAERKRLTRTQNAYIADIRRRCGALYADFMDSKEYGEFVRRKFKAADGELGGAAEIRADQKTAAILREAGSKNAKIVAGSVEKGFVAVSSGGDMEIHCTFDSFFEKIWREVAPSFVIRISEAVNRGV